MTSAAAFVGFEKLSKAASTSGPTTVVIPLKYLDDSGRKRWETKEPAGHKHRQVLLQSPHRNHLDPNVKSAPCGGDLLRRPLQAAFGSDTSWPLASSEVGCLPLPVVWLCEVRAPPSVSCSPLRYSCYWSAPPSLLIRPLNQDFLSLRLQGDYRRSAGIRNSNIDFALPLDAAS